MARDAPVDTRGSMLYTFNSREEILDFILNNPDYRPPGLLYHQRGKSFEQCIPGSQDFKDQCEIAANQYPRPGPVFCGNLGKECTNDQKITAKVGWYFTWWGQWFYYVRVIPNV